MKRILTVKKQGKAEVLFKQDVLDESIITVGNNPGATLELKDTSIAPEQFVIISENEQLLLMNRAVGTIINGEPLVLGGRIELKLGDEIEIGQFQLNFISNDTNGTQISALTNPEENDLSIKKPDEPLNPEYKKDFSTLLNNVKEEDSFYFHIIDRENAIERIIFDSDQIWLGTSFAENAVKKDKEELDEIYARVQKDWSGAVIYPEESEEIYLNGELLTKPSRLKNDDQLFWLDEFAEDEESQTSITFHEPVVLLALNSILPEELPEPVSLLPSETKYAINDADKDLDETDLNDEQIAKKQTIAVKKKQYRIFGYFSLLEIIIMAFGTLVTAAIIFLVLEYV